MLLFRKNDHLGLFENRSEAWCGHFRLENQQPVHRIDFPLCCSNSTSKKRGRLTWARLEKLKHAEHLSLALIFYTRESIHLKNLFIFGRRGWSEFANFTIWNFKWQARGAVNGQNSILFMLLLDTKRSTSWPGWSLDDVFRGKLFKDGGWLFSEAKRKYYFSHFKIMLSGGIVSEATYGLFGLLFGALDGKLSRVPLLQKVVTWFVWFGSDLSLRKFETKKISRFLAGLFMYLHKQKRRLR